MRTCLLTVPILSALSLAAMPDSARACQPFEGVDATLAREASTDALPLDGPLVVTISQYTASNVEPVLETFSIEVRLDGEPIAGRIALMQSPRRSRQGSDFVEAVNVGWYPDEDLRPDTRYDVTVRGESASVGRCGPGGPCVFHESEHTFTTGRDLRGALAATPRLRIEEGVHPTVCTQWEEGMCEHQECVASALDESVEFVRLHLSIEGPPSVYYAELTVDGRGVTTHVIRPGSPRQLLRSLLDDEVCARVELTDQLGRTDEFDLGCSPLTPEAAPQPEPEPQPGEPEPQPGEPEPQPGEPEPRPEPAEPEPGEPDPEARRAEENGCVASPGTPQEMPAAALLALLALGCRRR